MIAMFTFERVYGERKKKIWECFLLSSLRPLWGVVKFDMLTLKINMLYRWYHFYIHSH